VKSAEAKLESLLPMAKRIAGKIARRWPAAMTEDILAAAAVGAWETVRRHGSGTREQVRRQAVARVRGAIIDELRRLDWMPRRLRAEGAEFTKLSLDDMSPGDRDAALRSPQAHGLDMDEDVDPESLYEAMRGLPKREREILIDVYVRDKSAGEIAQKQHVSEPRISQLKKRALERLRDVLG
jgi:RNA polymerase sigma factor FliA